MSDEKTNEVNTEKKQVKDKRPSIATTYEKLQVSMPVLFLTCFSAVIIMIMICAGVFFANIKGAEQVLVPNVVGKTLEDGILDLQIKALYPNISFRYVEGQEEEGIILEQSPQADSIMKGFNTVNLVVSRGEEEEVPDFTGQSFDELDSEEETSDDSKKKALISYAFPSFVIDDSPAGTIIAQSPVAGTKIFRETEMQFVVSKGPSVKKVEVPALEGKLVEDVLQAMTTSGLIYDVSYHNPKNDETPGTVTAQTSKGTQEKYTRVKIEMALDDSLDNEIVSGVFKKTLIEYPVPVMMSVQAVTPDGTKFDVAHFQHIGGYVSIPYSVPRGSILRLYVLGDVKAETVIG